MNLCLKQFSLFIISYSNIFLNYFLLVSNLILCGLPSNPIIKYQTHILYKKVIFFLNNIPKHIIPCFLKNLIFLIISVKIFIFLILDTLGNAFLLSKILYTRYLLVVDIDEYLTEQFDIENQSLSNNMVKKSKKD